MTVVAVGAYPPPVAGQSIAMQLLHDWLTREGFAVEPIDIADPLERPSLASRVARTIRLALLAPRAVRRMRTGGTHGAVLYVQLGRSVIGLARDLPLLLTARMLGWPTVGHVHGGDYASLLLGLPPPLRALVRFALADVEVIALSDRLSDSIQRVLPGTRVHTVANGVDEGLRRRAMEHHRGPPGPPLRVLYLSNFIEAKGYIDVLRAAVRCQERDAAIRFTLIGDRTFTTHVDPAAFVAEHGLHNVSVGAAAERVDISDHLAAADVLVLPSRLEGQPLALLEAMQFGLALVATGVGAIPDLIEDGRNGYLLDPADDLAAQLATRLVTLANGDVLAGMQQASGASADCYSAERHGRAVADLLLRAGRNGRRRGPQS